MKEEDRHAEKTAAQTVAEVLGGLLEWRDTDDAAASIHDYDIVLTDGRIVAAEVTAVTLPGDRALEAELGRNFQAPLPGLRRRWWVDVYGQLPPRKTPRALAEELRVCLERLLPRFESSSPSRYDPAWKLPRPAARPSWR